jgi:hypothetical protein
MAKPSPSLVSIIAPARLRFIDEIGPESGPSTLRGIPSHAVVSWGGV